jgi:hypothetical protein
MPEADDPKRTLHLVVGTPDEDCPICRAHGLGKGDQGDNGSKGPLIIQELTVAEILRCPCPLCKEERENMLRT